MIFFVFYFTKVVYVQDLNSRIIRLIVEVDINLSCEVVEMNLKETSFLYWKMSVT